MVPSARLSRVPWWTLALVSGVLLTWWVPGADRVFVYDRAAIADGELWRLMTGHLVHFSRSHLLYNLAVLGVATWFIEAHYRRDAIALHLLAGSLIGVALFLGEPHMRIFGGASGIAYASVFYVALRGLTETLRWRLMCVSLCAIVIVKLLIEWLWGWSLAANAPGAQFVSVPLSHLVGIASAAILYLWTAATSALTLIPRLRRMFLAISRWCWAALSRSSVAKT